MNTVNKCKKTPHLKGYITKHWPLLYNLLISDLNGSKKVLKGGFPFPCQMPQSIIFLFENLQVQATIIFPFNFCYQSFKPCPHVTCKPSNFWSSVQYLSGNGSSFTAKNTGQTGTLEEEYNGAPSVLKMKLMFAGLFKNWPASHNLLYFSSSTMSVIIDLLRCLLLSWIAFHVPSPEKRNN